jgi:hypothetical protein
MESGAIKESQLTASSIRVESNSHTLSPNLCRLKHNSYWGVAIHQTSVKNNFIQVDFRKVVRIEEVSIVIFKIVYYMASKFRAL